MSETLIGQARRRTAQAVIREAADAWAKNQPVLKPENVLAAFVRALSIDVRFGSTGFNQGSGTIWNSRPYGDVPIRPLSELLENAGALSEELRRLAPGVTDEVCAECASQLLEVCSAAANQWQLGDPEQPSTDEVTLSLARILFDSGCYTLWDWRSVRP